MGPPAHHHQRGHRPRYPDASSDGWDSLQVVARNKGQAEHTRASVHRACRDAACASPKSRVVDDVLAVHYLAHEDLQRPVPDYPPTAPLAPRPNPRPRRGGSAALKLWAPLVFLAPSRHQFGRTPAYLSDCEDWIGFDIYIYRIGLRNIGREPIPFRLRDFVLVARGGSSQAPVGVRGEANLPQLYLNWRAIIPPRIWLTGYLVFDARVNFVPDRLSYVDRKTGDVLTLKFDRGHTVAN